MNVCCWSCHGTNEYECTLNVYKCNWKNDIIHKHVHTFVISMATDV